MICARDRQPEPGALRASAVSVSPTWRNFSKMISLVGCADAGAVVAHVDPQAVCPSCASAHLHAPVRPSQNLAALESRFSSTCMQAVAVGDDERHALGQLRLERDVPAP